MPQTLIKLRARKLLYKKAGAAVSFGTIGEIIGYLIAQFIPDTILPDVMVTHGIATLLALISVFIFSSKYRTNSGNELKDCLADADLLFAEGFIDEKQLMKMRERCLEKFLKSNV